MPIDFRCPSCNKLLRTADDSAGKQAKCPDCGAVMTIPAMTEPVPPALPVNMPDMYVSPRPQGQSSASDYGYDPAAWGGESGMPGDGSPRPIMPTRISIEDVFSRTWAIFREQWGMCLLVMFVVFVVNFVVQQILGAMSHATRDREARLIIQFVTAIVSGGFSLWLSIGQGLFFLKVARGRRPDFGEVFTGAAPYFLPVLGAGILFGLIVLVGFVCLIIPAIFFGLMFSQYYFLILDRRVDIIESLSLSKQITDGNKLTLLLIAIVSFVLSVIAMIPCGLGLLIAVPYFALMAPVVYLMMTGQPTADQLQKKILEQKYGRM